MNREVIKVVLVLFAIAGMCRAAGCNKELAVGQSKVAKSGHCSVDAVLKKLDQRTLGLRSYEGQIEYLFSQPLFESQTLRKGTLYYKKSGDKSKLRINFQTLRQDDEKEQKYIEEYIFDGVWLTHIDYQIKSVKKHQLAEVNEPINAFELVGRHLPIVGFSGVGELRKDFEIKLVEQKEVERSSFIRLHLEPKADSVYKDDYASIDFWIDRKANLPSKISAVSVEEDIYQIRLLGAKVNEKINSKVFEFKIPKGFGQPEVIPLKKKSK